VVYRVSQEYLVKRVRAEPGRIIKRMESGNPVDDYQWMDPYYNYVTFLDFTHNLIRRVGGVEDGQDLHRYHPRWARENEIGRYACYNRKRGIGYDQVKLEILEFQDKISINELMRSMLNVVVKNELQEKLEEEKNKPLGLN